MGRDGAVGGNGKYMGVKGINREDKGVLKSNGGDGEVKGKG